MDNRRKTYSVAEAKSGLSGLLDRVEAGEKIMVTRRGRPIVQISPVRAARPGIDFARLRALRASTPKTGESAAKLVRRMRDEKY